MPAFPFASFIRLSIPTFEPKREPRVRRGARGGSARLAAVIVAALGAGTLRPAAAPANPSPEPDSTRSAPAQDIVYGIPRVEYPGSSSVAVQDDASALFANPAAIDRSVPLGYFLLWEDAEPGGIDRGAIGLTAGPLGLGYQQTLALPGGNLSRWSFALGGGTRASFSGGVRAVRERLRRPGVDAKTWRWDLGVLWRPRPCLSLGATIEDATQSRLGDTLYRRHTTLGVGLRPLPGELRSRLTLFADLSGREGTGWDQTGRLATGVIAEPLRSLWLSGSVSKQWGGLTKDSAERVYRVGIGIGSARSTGWVGARFDEEPGGAKEERTRTVYAIEGSTARQPSLRPEPVVARVRLAGRYGDEGQSGVPIPLPMLGAPSYASIRPVLRDLERAATERDVRGVLIDLGPLGVGPLTSEVRDAIGRVRAAGKPVVAYMDECEGIGQYHVASACDRIVVDPLGGVARLGLRIDMLYFGEMLDSAGVTVEKLAHGKYKTAGEQLVLNRASEGQKEAFHALLDDWRDLYLGDLSSGRRIPREKMEELSDGRMFTAEQALAAGLVDTLADREGAQKLLNRLARRPEKSKPVPIGGWRERRAAWADGPKVAVLWLDGAIATGKSTGGFLSENVMGSETVVARLRSLRDRGDVRAVVLRVDSPGGSALASDQIWRAVDELRKKGKKVVASMSRVAASGGYYISCGADEILADPGTITGSIGVLGLKPHLAGFYQRHRIGVETFERGGMMGMYSSAVPLTEGQKAHLQAVIDDVYEKFLRRVAACRPLTRDEIDAVGQGRIWTGRQALERKLIDRIGGLHEAVERARALAGLPDDAVVEHLCRSRWGFLAALREGAAGAARGFGSLVGLCSAPAPREVDSASEGADAETLAALLPLAAAMGAASDPLEAWFLRRVWQERLRGEPGAIWLYEDPLAARLLGAE